MKCLSQFEDIKRHTDADKSLCLLKNYIQSGFPAIVDCELSRFKNFKTELSIMKGCIMYNNRVFIPTSLREKVLAVFHDGHPGICAMKILTNALIWYPGIEKDITQILSTMH